MNQQTIILIGRSGCGKGTQGDLLAKHLKASDTSRDVLYVQAGSEFRKFIQGESYTQKLCKDIIEKGKLAPEFLSIFMWVNFLVNNFKGTEHLIIDGTPRKYHEAGVLESIFDFYQLPKPHVFHINVSKEWASARLFGRKRQDDIAEDIERRMAWFETETAKAIDYYRQSPLYTFVEINGEDTIEKVHETIVSKI